MVNESGSKTLLTWRGEGVDRLEQVRANISGSRLRAHGRIISAATDDYEAFSASYELVTNDVGVLRRVSVTMLTASGETSLDLSRDMDSRWRVQTQDSAVYSDFGGAESVDVGMSPLFKSLPIRRHGLIEKCGETIDVPVVYLHLPDCTISPMTVTYSVGAEGVAVISPHVSSTVSVDSNGLVVDFPGIAQRI